MIDFPVGPRCGSRRDDPEAWKPRCASRSRPSAPRDLGSRGFRIEDGEIECTLLQHPAVADAVVLPVESRTGSTELVAYCVARPGPAMPALRLRQFLLERLPPDMVPAKIAFLPELLRTADGMIDRRVLPA